MNKTDAFKKRINHFAQKTVSVGLRNPSKDLDITIVFGESNIGLFLQKIFQESSLKTAIFCQDNISVCQKELSFSYDKPSLRTLIAFLREAKKSQTDHVILVLNKGWLKKARTISPQAVVIGHGSVLDFQGIDVVRSWNSKDLYQIIFSGDDVNYLSYKEIFDNVNQISYGENENNDVKITKIKFYKKGMEVSLKIDMQTSLDLASYLNDKQDVYSLTAAVSAGYVAGIKLKDIVEGIALLGEE